MIIGLLRAMALTGGEWVIYILILCSILAIAVIVERSMIFKKEKEQLKSVRDLFGAYMENDNAEAIMKGLKEIACLPARVLSEGISKLSKGIYTVEETMASVSTQERRRLELHMLILNTLGNNAIYVGLFGTLLGVIQAFRDLAYEVGAGPEIVMQGLSEALLATAVGLLVAIPSVIGHNIFQKQIKDIVSESDSMTHLLLARLKTSEGGRTGRN